MYIVSFVVGLVLTWVYGSFAEWALHKYGMHNPRVVWAYERHAKTHHVERLTGGTFYGHESYRILQSSAIPLVLFLHAPLYWVIAAAWNTSAAIGFAVGATAYILAYESLHFLIHDPPSWIQFRRWFQWYCEYHRVHHYKVRWNYNVVVPLADLVLCTYSSMELPPEPSAPEELSKLTGPASVFRR